MEKSKCGCTNDFSSFKRRFFASYLHVLARSSKMEKGVFALHEQQRHTQNEYEKFLFDCLFELFLDSVPWIYAQRRLCLLIWGIHRNGHKEKVKFSTSAKNRGSILIKWFLIFNCVGCRMYRDCRLKLTEKWYWVEWNERLCAAHE